MSKKEKSYVTPADRRLLQNIADKLGEARFHVGSDMELIYTLADQAERLTRLIAGIAARQL